METENTSSCQIYCNACNRTFTRVYNYERHKETNQHKLRESKTQTKKYDCICGKQFLYRQSYHRHKKNCTNVCKDVVPIEQVEEPKQVKEPKQVEEPKPSKESVNIKKELKTIKQLIKGLELRVKSLENPTPSQPSSPPQPTHPIITPRKRHKIPNAWRPIIATKQDQLCGICKNNLPLHYHLDHIVALQFGGTDHQDNLMALCYDCHVQKSKRELACREEIRHVVQNVLNMQAIHI